MSASRITLSLDKLRELLKAAFHEGFAAARKGTVDTAWEDSRTRHAHDYERRNP